MESWIESALETDETESVEFKSTFNIEAIESLAAFANRKRRRAGTMRSATERFWGRALAFQPPYSNQPAFTPP